jgi:hypothetical protein
MHPPFVTAVPSVMVISVLRRYCAASSGPIPNTIDRELFRLPVEDQQKQTADYKPQQTSSRKCAAERRSSSPRNRRKRAPAH